MSLDPEERQLLNELHFTVTKILDPALSGDDKGNPGLIRRVGRLETEVVRAKATVRTVTLLVGGIVTTLTLAVGAAALWVH